MREVQSRAEAMLDKHHSVLIAIQEKRIFGNFEIAQSLSNCLYSNKHKSKLVFVSLHHVTE